MKLEKMDVKEEEEDEEMFPTKQHRKDESFRVFVHNLSGRSVSYVVFPGDTVASLMCKIHAKENVSPDDQRLIVGHTQLDPMRRLDDYGIFRDFTISLCGRLRGD